MPIEYILVPAAFILLIVPKRPLTLPESFDWVIMNKTDGNRFVMPNSCCILAMAGAILVPPVSGFILSHSIRSSAGQIT